MVFLRSVFLASFILFTSLAFAQARIYDLVFLGDSVGEVEIQKKVINSDSYSIHFDSKAQASLFFVKTTTRATTTLVFKNDILEEGQVYRKKNDDIHNLTYKWNGSSYLIKDNEKNIVVDKPINFCTANFFITEPKDVKEVFVERFNYFVPVESLGNHEYLTRVDGGTNLYTYKDGVLQSVKSTKGITIYMKLRD